MTFTVTQVVLVLVALVGGAGSDGAVNGSVDYIDAVEIVG